MTNTIKGTTNPAPITEFFAHSRLSFIGSWRERWSDLLDALEEENGPGFLCEETMKPSSITPRVVLHVDLDAFFASVSLMDQPAEMRTKPVVICWSNAKAINSDSEVSCPNYPARALGIHAGMFLRTAKQLCQDAGMLDELIALPCDFEKYAHVSGKVWRLLFTYTQRIEGVSCDEAFLDVTDCIQDMGGGPEAPYQFALAIQSRVHDEFHGNITCSIGVGPSKIVARLATALAKRRQGPGSCFAIKPHEVAQALAPLSPDMVHGIGRETFKSLTKILRKDELTIHDVTQLPLTRLRAEFGEIAGDNIYWLVRGGKMDGQEEWNLRPKHRSISKQASWGIRAVSDDDVVTKLCEFVDLVVAKMTKRGIKCRCVKVKVWIAVVNQPADWRKGTQGSGLCDVFEDSLSLKEFTTDPIILKESCAVLFRRLRDGKKFHVKETMGLGVVVTKFDNEHNESATTTTLVKRRRLGGGIPKRGFTRREFVNGEVGLVPHINSGGTVTTSANDPVKLLEHIVNEIKQAKSDDEKRILVQDILTHELCRAFQETKGCAPPDDAQCQRMTTFCARCFNVHDQAVREALHWVQCLAGVVGESFNVLLWAHTFVQDRWGLDDLAQDNILRQFSDRGGSVMFFNEVLNDLMKE